MQSMGQLTISAVMLSEAAGPRSGMTAKSKHPYTTRQSAGRPNFCLSPM